MIEKPFVASSPTRSGSLRESGQLAQDRANSADGLIAGEIAALDSDNVSWNLETDAADGHQVGEGGAILNDPAGGLGSGAKVEEVLKAARANEIEKRILILGSEAAIGIRHRVDVGILAIGVFQSHVIEKECAREWIGGQVSRRCKLDDDRERIRPAPVEAGFEREVAATESEGLALAGIEPRSTHCRLPGLVF